MATGKLYIGRRVRDLRQANRATQAQFAERLGISVSYLNQIENNQRPVSAGVLLAPVAMVVATAGFLSHDLPWLADATLLAAVALAAGGRWAARSWQGEEPGPLPFAVERALLSLGAGLALVAGVLLTVALASSRDGLQPLAGVLMLAAAGAAWLHGVAPDAGWRRVAGAMNSGLRSYSSSSLS